MYRSCWANRSFSEDNGEVGADAVAFIAHSPKMRDALGIVMPAPLVFLPAGSSPKKRPDHIVSDEEKDSILSPGNFLSMTDSATRGPARLDCIRGSRGYEFICISFLSTVPFSERSNPFEKTGTRQAGTRQSLLYFLRFDFVYS